MMILADWPLAAATAAVWGARSRAAIRRLRTESEICAKAGRREEARERARLADDLESRYGKPSEFCAADRNALAFILAEAQRNLRAASSADDQAQRDRAAFEVMQALADRTALDAEMQRAAK